MSAAHAGSRLGSANTRWAPDDDRGGPPQPGYFLLKLVRGGPLVPAQIIVLAQPSQEGAGPLWQARINGEIQDLGHTDPLLARGVYRIWHGGLRSTKPHCDYLDSLRAWAAVAQPGHPLLNPERAIDIARLAPVIP